jgi:hypothetical protein
VKVSRLAFLRRVFLTITFDVVIGSAVVAAQVRCPADTRPGDRATQFHVGGSSIQMPVGAFLLIRKGGQIGTIRVTNIDPVATEYYGKSSYESYLPTDGVNSFSTATTIRRTGPLDIRPAKGPGRNLWIYQPGPNKARVGNWTFYFVRPGLIWMPSSHSSSDKNYEFAPTSACDISEIDAHDNRLRWFRSDPNANITLPLTDLPK